LLLSQQPDNTHGIYRATRERDPNLANRSRSH
jgi:hypothetical protein